MSVRDSVVVKILDAPGPAGCGCGSPAPGGPSHSAPVQDRCEELRAALEKRFPGKARLEYRNLVEHRDERKTPAGQLLVNRTVPPPVVVVDGEPRFWGSIPILSILELVGELLREQPAGMET